MVSVSGRYAVVSFYLCILSFHFGDLLLGYQVLVIIVVLFVSCEELHLHMFTMICFQVV